MTVNNFTFFGNAKISRRRFVSGIAAGGALIGMGVTPSSASTKTSPSKNTPVTLIGNQFNLNIGYLPVNFTGSERIATSINNSVPAPILRWKEGDMVKLKVTNNLAEDSSIHSHGIILPSNMDGVPGLSFGGIKPGETFEYEFKVNQSGTYWYHCHSGFQEQTGLYGAIVIDPKEPDPVSYDRDYVVLLSDWSDESPSSIYSTLKKQSDYYNFRERTASDLWREIKDKGLTKTWNDRSMWNMARMSDRDLSDVTSYTYTYLMNGFTSDERWKALFKRGEKVRLRFINSAAMTIFDIRIPGLKIKVVTADGQSIEPVSVDEFRIGVAETYDVIVEPSDDSAYSIFAQSIDRTGFIHGTLTPDLSLSAAPPEMDPAPLLGHGDMGVAMNHQGMEAISGNPSIKMSDGMSMDHSQMNHSQMDHSQMNHDVENLEKTKAMNPRLSKVGLGSDEKIIHVDTEFGPHVDMRSVSPKNGINDPGIGLRNHQQRYGRRVLKYADLKNLYQTKDPSQPDRELQLHLTGNMSRYMWSMNGVKFADAEPLSFKYGERLRITLVNDTMMTHPMHLHGMWSELETGDDRYIPRKHTVMVQPGSKISYLVSADALGAWAYHCHLLYHMPGMFRKVVVA